MAGFFDTQFSLSRSERLAHKMDRLRSVITTGTWNLGEGYTVQLVNFSIAETSVTLFVRVWKDGQQIGFGSDGSIDVEKITIINPPIFVSNPNGDIVIVASNNDYLPGIGGTTAKFSEAPLLAFRNAVLETLKRKKELVLGSQNIVPGTVGQSTLTVYSEVGDGTVSRTTENTWALSRDASTGNAVEYTGTFDLYPKSAYYGGKYYNSRAFMSFDTSAIGAGTVSSATLTLRLWQRSCCGYTSNYRNITSGSPASTSSLVNDDYNNIGTSRWASDVLIDGNETGTPAKNWVFNSTGIANVNGSGFTSVCLRTAMDIDNTAPTVDGNVNFYSSESTSYDPVLVIEYTAVTFIPRTAFFM